MNGKDKTLRDEFAMVVLEGLMSIERNGVDEDPETEPLATFIKSTATASYMFADAMLEARKK